MHKCLSCGEIFAEPVVHVEMEPYEFWGQLGMAEVRIETCADCGSEEFEEFVPCHTCGENEAMDGYDDCGACVEELDDED